MIKDIDLEDIKPFLRERIAKKYGIIRVPGSNKYGHRLYKINHTCGHQEITGSNDKTINRFVANSMLSEILYCSNCFDAAFELGMITADN